MFVWIKKWFSTSPRGNDLEGHRLRFELVIRYLGRADKKFVDFCEYAFRTLQAEEFLERGVSEAYSGGIQNRITSLETSGGNVYIHEFILPIRAEVHKREFAPYFKLREKINKRAKETNEKYIVYTRLLYEVTDERTGAIERWDNQAGLEFDKILTTIHAEGTEYGLDIKPEDLYLNFVYTYYFDIDGKETFGRKTIPGHEHELKILKQKTETKHINNIFKIWDTLVSQLMTDKELKISTSRFPTIVTLNDLFGLNKEKSLDEIDELWVSLHINAIPIWKFRKLQTYFFEKATFPEPISYQYIPVEKITITTDDPRLTGPLSRYEYFARKKPADTKKRKG